MKIEESNNLATLLGGIDLTVKKLDGTSEAVRVHQLALNQYPEILSRIDDEAALAELYVAKPKDWALSLTPESYTEVITEGDRLNADFFWQWLRRRMARMERVRPGLAAQVEGLALANMPPKPPSSAA